jgi:hypothetical protein
MNSLVLAALGILVFTPAALAANTNCPLLTGTYACKTAEGISELTISQEQISVPQEPIKTYTLYTTTSQGNTTQTPTDTYVYSLNDVENNIKGTAQFYCANSAFVSRMTGQKSDGKNTVVATWAIDQALSLNPKGDLQIAVQGHLTENGKTTPSNETNVCLRETKPVK